VHKFTKMSAAYQLHYT